MIVVARWFRLRFGLLIDLRNRGVEESRREAEKVCLEEN
jgi:hypothetical protein